MTNFAPNPSDIIHEFTVGSKMYGLDTDSSDTDKLVLYVDFESRLFPDAKLNVKVSDEDTEIDYIEVGEFIKHCLTSPNLKETEVLCFMWDNDLGFKSTYLGTDIQMFMDIRHVYDMYHRELNRRYNKLWFREHNKSGKNFSADVALDVKYAAHLYRVLYSAEVFLGMQKDSDNDPDLVDVTVNFSPIKDRYLKIRNGEFSKEDIFDMTDSMYKELLPQLPRFVPTDLEIRQQKEDAKKVYWRFIRHLSEGRF